MVVCGVCAVTDGCEVIGEAAVVPSVFGSAEVGVCGAELTGVG